MCAWCRRWLGLVCALWTLGVRSADTDQIDKFNGASGMSLTGRFPDLDAIRRSRLKKCTIFEMDETPEVKMVQDEYLRIAAMLAAGVPAQPGRPLKDREIFDLLGYD